MESLLDLTRLNNPGYYNKIFFPLLQPHPDKRYFILYGGRDTGKSHFIAQVFLRQCLEADYFKGILVRSTYNTIKESQFETLKEVATMMQIDHLFHWLVAPLEVRCRINSNRIIARGMDNAEKLKSVSNPTHTWYEEADQISEDDWETVSLSLRNSKGAKTEEWFSFNAGSPKHWLINRFFPDDQVYEEPDGSHTLVESTDPKAVIVHTNHQMNEFLTPERLDIYLHMKERKPKRYKIHGLGLLGREVQGALWTDALLDDTRVSRYPGLSTVHVAVDPSASEREDGDEAGIVVVGKSQNGHAYVLRDGSGQMSPSGWAKRCIQLYHEYEADAVVAEVNQGWDMVVTIIRQIDPTVPVIKVKASRGRGKYTRAQPVSNLYEQGLVHHVGHHPKLEEQLTTWIPEASKSPDRLDALVWGVTSLIMPRGRRPDRGVT